MGFLERKKSLAEIEEEDEHVQAELSLAQKQTMLREVRARGGDPAMFRGRGGIDFKAIWQWLKTH